MRCFFEVLGGIKRILFVGYCFCESRVEGLTFVLTLIAETKTQRIGWTKKKIFLELLR